VFHQQRSALKCSVKSSIIPSSLLLSLESANWTALRHCNTLLHEALTHLLWRSITKKSSGCSLYTLVATRLQKMSWAALDSQWGLWRFLCQAGHRRCINRFITICPKRFLNNDNLQSTARVSVRLIIKDGLFHPSGKLPKRSFILLGRHTRRPLHRNHLWSTVPPHLTSNHFWLVHQTFLALTSRHLVAKKEKLGGKRPQNFAYEVSLSHLWGSLTCVKILRHGTNGFAPLRNELC
jgi:hypothetical protein